MKLWLNILMIWALASLAGCVTTEEEPPKPPAITEDMDLEDAVNAAVDFGGPTLEQVKALVTKRKQWPQVRASTIKGLTRNVDSLSDSQIVHVANLYQTATETLDANIFLALIGSKRVLAKQLGWQLAANLPSAEVAKLLDDTLTDLVVKGLETENLVVPMANAVRSNNLKSAYTLMRQGLMETGEDAFARTMIQLDPVRASDDFLDYLALAPIEELRQLNQTSVNMYACLVILRHQLHFPPSLSNPNYEHLFLFAISRNQGLSELANEVLENAFGRYRQHLAMVLVRLPAWMQVAYIENARRNINPKVSLFLGELQKVSGNDDVQAELSEVVR